MLSPAADGLPSVPRSLARSLKLGHEAEPLLLVVALVTTVLAAAPDALFALGLSALVDAVLDSDDSRVVLLAALLGVLATGSWLITVLSERIGYRLTDRAGVHIEAHVGRLMASVPTIEHHERPDHVDRLWLLREQAGTLSQLYQMLFSVVGALLRLAITLALLMSVAPVLGVLGILAVPTVVVSGRRAAVERRVEEGVAQHERRARAMFVAGTTAGPAKEVRVARVQGLLRDVMDESWLQRYRALARARWVSAAYQVGAYALFAAAFVGAVAFVAGRDGSAGQVLLVLVAGGRLAQYLGQTVRETHFFRTIWLDGARRLTWLEDLAAAAGRHADLTPPDRLATGIALSHVCFRYPGTDRDVLTDVSLTLPAGAVVAVVGENGAGKSSLVKLLCKLYEPTTGEIDVDGRDLTRIPADAWRARVAGAFQDFVRFEYPAQQSVGVGDVDRVDDRAAVEVAVTRAGAGDLVAGLPDGLDTPLGATWTDGVDLSQGQWQKVALSRALMQDRPLLLVLDEPTSALDAEAEHALFDRYAAAARSVEVTTTGRITVLVSHRFSTVRMADLIIVISGGRVVEYGSHAELIGRAGVYAELFELQAAAYR
jgi:ATP-binding cassette, subfamily B, bacterial